MLISVVIPTYNSEEYLEETLLSVINQDYPEKEILIIDGGSKDNTIDIIKKYEKDIAYWKSEKDLGQFDAMNKGILAAKGDVIGILGGDDIYKPNSLKLIAKAFTNFPDEKLIYGELERIDMNSKKINNYGAKQTNFKELATKRCYIPCQSAFFKKDIISDIGLIDLKYKWSSDWEFWIRVCKKYGCKFIPETLACWRINPNNTTFNVSKGYHNRYLEVAKISYKYAKNPFAYLFIGNMYEIFMHFFPLSRRNLKRFIKR
jgi:glycosyltransferase involved in cell wall biosynthesis